MRKVDYFDTTTTATMHKDDVARIAAGLSAMDQSLLHDYPLRAGRTWKTPVRFYSGGLVKTRRRFVIFGPFDDVLTRFGKKVRNHLTENRDA